MAQAEQWAVEREKGRKKERSGGNERVHAAVAPAAAFAFGTRVVAEAVAAAAPGDGWIQKTQLNIMIQGKEFGSQAGKPDKQRGTANLMFASVHVPRAANRGSSQSRAEEGEGREREDGSKSSVGIGGGVGRDGIREKERTWYELHCTHALQWHISDGIKMIDWQDPQSSVLSFPCPILSDCVCMPAPAPLVTASHTPALALFQLKTQDMPLPQLHWQSWWSTRRSLRRESLPRAVAASSPPASITGKWPPSFSPFAAAMAAATAAGAVVKFGIGNRKESGAGRGADSCPPFSCSLPVTHALTLPTSVTLVASHTVCSCATACVLACVCVPARCPVMLHSCLGRCSCARIARLVARCCALLSCPDALLSSSSLILSLAAALSPPDHSFCASFQLCSLCR